MLDSSGRAQQASQHGRGLSAELLTEKALEIVNAEGYEALSFRHLGKAAGCEAMSLYHYFKSKAHLRDAMIDRVLDNAEIDTDASKPLRARIMGSARSFRRALLTNPGLAPVVLSHALDQAAGQRWLGAFAALFAESGLPVPEQAQQFRMVWAAMNGALLDELRLAHLVPTAAEPASEDELAAIPGAALLVQSDDKAARHEAFVAIVGAQVDCLFARAAVQPETVVAAPQPAPAPAAPRSRQDIKAARRARRRAKQQQ